MDTAREKSPFKDAILASIVLHRMVSYTREEEAWKSLSNVLARASARGSWPRETRSSHTLFTTEHQVSESVISLPN